MKSAYLATVAIMLWAAIAVAQTTQYDFYPAGDFPNSYETTALAISRRYIVGNYFAANKNAAYVQTGKQFRDAAPSNSKVSYLSGINSHGVAVGGFCPLGCNPETGQHGYTFNTKTGGIHVINFPMKGAGTAAYGINDNGIIVGGYCPGSVVCPQGAFNPTSHGFVDDHGTFTTLDFPNAQDTTARAINDDGVIVGFYVINATGPHAFMYENGMFTNIDFPGAAVTEATAVNNHGDIAGWFSDAAIGSHGFIYHKGKFTQIDKPGTTSTAVFGINDCDELVGFWYPSLGFPKPFQAVPDDGPDEP